MVLLEERLGCLDKTVRSESQEFINSVGTMFLTGHQLMVFAEVHKALGTGPWKRHVAAWDTIYDFGMYQYGIINKVKFIIQTNLMFV